MGVFVTAVQPLVEQIARRPGDLVQAAIVAPHPALFDIPARHVERAAGDVDERPLAGHQFTAFHRHRAAHRGPFADAMPAGAQIAAHLQQAARGVPTLALIAIDALGHMHQRAPIHPDIVVVQELAFPIDRRVAQLVALNVDLQVVGLHRHLDPDGARDIQQRAVVQQGAAIRHDGDLAASGQGQRAILRLDRAAAGQLDARLVAAIGQAGKVIERLARRPVRVRLVQHRTHQRVALGIQRGRAVVLQQDRGGGILAQQNRATGVAGGIEQVYRAARGHRGAGHRHAQLAHVVPGQRDVTQRRLDQAGVGHRACLAPRIAARRHFVAARGGNGVDIGSKTAPDDERITRRQHGLAIRRRYLARIVNVAPQQQDIAAALRHAVGRGGLDAGARFHAHARAGIAGLRPIAQAGQVVTETGGIALVHAVAGLGAVQALAELVVAHAHRGGHQVAGVDLAAAGKDDTVAIDQHDGTRSLDLPLYLAGTRARVVDPVQHRPRRALLLEGHRGVASDVERFPIQDGLVRGLFDSDNGTAAAHRLRIRRQGARVDPAGRQRIGIHFQTALTDPIRYGDRLIHRCLACRGLRGLLRGDGRGAAVQIGQRTLKLFIGTLLVAQRRRNARQSAARQAPGGGGLGLRGPLVGEPARPEGRAGGQRRRG